MDYKAKDIDVDKFLKQLDWLTKNDSGQEQREKIAIEKFHEGYRKALEQVESMFYCSNYEK